MSDDVSSAARQEFLPGQASRGTGSLASRDLPNTPHHGALAFCRLDWALTCRRFCWRNIFHTFGVLVVVEFPVRRPPYGITFRTTDPGIRFEITNRWHRNTLEITNRCSGNTERNNGGESEQIHHGRPPFFAISVTRKVAVLQPGNYTASADGMLR